MKQWDIYSFNFPQGRHPAVILSPDDQCLNADFLELNILFASSARPMTRNLKRFEVVLDQADGLDWQTAVRCHKIHLISKIELTGFRGHVSAVRQREICRRIAEVFAFRF